jgi:hypothetical protein
MPRFVALDRRTIRQLQPGEKKTEHGVTVERLANGDVRYTVGVMVGGQRIHRVIGLRTDGITRPQAEQYIEQQRADARARRLSLPEGHKLALSLADATPRYIEWLGKAGGKNLRVKARQLRMYLVPHFGSIRLNAINEFSIETYKKKRHDAGAASGTINRELTTLSQLFYCAVEWHWIDHIPLRIGPRLLKESDGRIIVLTETECDQLMEAPSAGATAN